jgi:hypothetical protein
MLISCIQHHQKNDIDDDDDMKKNDDVDVEEDKKPIRNNNSTTATATANTTTQKSSKHQQQQQEKEEKAVYIKIDTYKMLEECAHKNDTSIRQFVNNILKLYLRKEDFLKKYFPYLSLYTIGKESLFIKDLNPEKNTSKDNNTNKDIKRFPLVNSATAEIVMLDYRDPMMLFCSLDQAEDCKHIHYALALLEISLLPLTPTEK